MSYTKKHLRDDVEDQAAQHGLSETQEARFARGALQTEHVGINYLTVKPGKQEAFAHRHREAEEVIVVLAGSGSIDLDGETVELRELDAVRVGPGLARRLAAGESGLEVLVFGARVENDAEIVKDG